MELHVSRRFPDPQDSPGSKIPASFLNTLVWFAEHPVADILILDGHMMPAEAYPSTFGVRRSIAIELYRLEDNPYSQKRIITHLIRQVAIGKDQLLRVLYRRNLPFFYSCLSSIKRVSGTTLTAIHNNAKAWMDMFCYLARKHRLSVEDELLLLQATAPSGQSLPQCR